MKSPLGLNAELPVWDLIREALMLLWGKRADVLRMFLPLMLVLATIDWISSFWLAEDAQAGRLLFVLVSSLLSVLFATSCHRFTLLPPEQWDGNALHGFGRDEWRYMLRGIQIAVIAIVICFSCMLGLMLIMGKDQAWLAAALAVLPTLYFWSRLSVTLPELALGKQSDLKRAWAISSGNGSRLVLVVFIVPVLLASPFLVMFFSDHAVLGYIAAFGTYLTTLISLVMLSLAYRFLLDFYADADNLPIADTREDSDKSAQESASKDGGFDA
ncbi:hypothetical protein ACQUQU_04180 [Thalassolituus sp. LLYu03]|uniref:hypothetical protein n=1 Tax=Thalassolituus sp. LLYu03 TaxID=3421656 RepID=UPI003D27FE00